MLKPVKYSIIFLGLILLMSANTKSKDEDPKHLNYAAIDLIEEENYDSAIYIFNKIIKLDPEFPDAYYNRGGCKQAIGNHHGAISDFDKAIDLKPKDADSYFNRGISKYMIDAYRGAITDFTKALELDPSYTIAYYDRAFCEVELGMSAQACKDFHTAYQLGIKEAKKQFKEVCSR